MGLHRSVVGVGDDQLVAKLLEAARDPLALGRGLEEDLDLRYETRTPSSAGATAAWDLPHPSAAGDSPARSGSYGLRTSPLVVIGVRRLSKETGSVLMAT